MLSWHGACSLRKERKVVGPNGSIDDLWRHWYKARPKKLTSEEMAAMGQQGY